ncbi:MAG: GTP pyrophosphokinase family protein [Clostridia bacterium]|nr:GTP pyrophosphokinase family protein [Clostridia bacterium]MBQ9856155.1 GTP pyrophosphokinase family protein [Clostridia bacterium]
MMNERDLKKAQMENWMSEHGNIDEMRDKLEWMTERSQPFRELMAYYKCAMMEVETKFNVLNQEFSVQYDRNPIESIRSRIKEPPSILDKLLRNKLPMTIESMEENLSDVAGVRVICSFIEDIYMLAGCLLKQDDVTLIRYKDYIKNPKENGYRSLHLIVEVPIFLAHKKKLMKVEIQLRTIAMDFWASLEHKLKYKKNRPDSELLTQELKECADMSAQLDERMEQIRKSVIGDEIIE